MSFVNRSRTEPHSRFVFSALPPDNILCLTLLFCQWQFYKYISFFIQICPPGGGAINAIRSDTAVAEWQSGYNYAIGDYCLHNGYLYRSITNGSHSGWHDEYFEIVTLKSNRDSINYRRGFYSTYLAGGSNGRTYNIGHANGDQGFFFFGCYGNQSVFGTIATGGGDTVITNMGANNLAVSNVDVGNFTLTVSAWKNVTLFSNFSFTAT